MPDEEITDSPIDWVAKHIRDYVATDGRERKGTCTALTVTAHALTWNRDVARADWVDSPPRIVTP